VHGLVPDRQVIKPTGSLQSGARRLHGRSYIVMTAQQCREPTSGPEAIERTDLRDRHLQTSTYPQAEITSRNVFLVSASSVKGTTIVVSQAFSRLMPHPIKRPALTSMRVEAPSSSP
jgi:hypothetical protein